MDNDVINTQSMQSLIDKAYEDWGEPEINAKSTVRSGVPTLDNIIYGFEKGLTAIIGSSGSRKTTFMANCALYNGASRRVEYRVPQVILSSESGMFPEVYRDSLIAMLSTLYLRHWQKEGKLSQETPPYLFRNFFRYHSPNEEQEKAIGLAMRDLRESPIWILGSGKYGGVDNLENYPAIFNMIEHELGLATVYVDHLHSIFVRGIYGDYESLLTIVPQLSNLIKVHGFPVIAAAQVSSSSVKANAMEARGGTMIREESNLYFRINYLRIPYHRMRIELDKSRQSGDKITIDIEIENNSGLIIDDGKLIGGSEDIREFGRGDEEYNVPLFKE